jgi:mannose-6-phosphate isomerase
MTAKVHPLRLRADNFTPPARTPWGGTRMLQRYKAGLGLSVADPHAPRGEAWELSVSDELPSATASGELLRDVLARDPGAWLGREAARGGTALLVKWLDAADDLSLQIHPEDDYRGLGASEAGKLEGWYVLERDPDALIYFGFRSGVGLRDVRRALDGGADVSALMAPCSVAPGDFLLVEPGTPHAIGRGITLLEPQLVVPGKRGLTYRYWDWNRRYDAAGKPSANGKPRELHVEHALAVTRWDRACDPAWLGSRRIALGWPRASAQARCELVCGPDAPLPCAKLRVARLFGTGNVALPAWDALRSLTVIEGTLRLDGQLLPAGTTAAVPAACSDLAAELQAAHALVVAAG